MKRAFTIVVLSLGSECQHDSSQARGKYSGGGSEDPGRPLSYAIARFGSDARPQDGTVARRDAGLVHGFAAVP
jgi:hypothetical protein